MMLSECCIRCGLQDTLSGTVGLNIHTLAREGLRRWQSVAHRREATPEVPLIQPRAQAQADSWLLPSSPAAFSLIGLSDPLVQEAPGWPQMCWGPGHLLGDPCLARLCGPLVGPVIEVLQTLGGQQDRGMGKKPKRRGGVSGQGR